MGGYDLGTVIDDALMAKRNAVLEGHDEDWVARGEGAAWRASSLGSCPRGQILGRLGWPSTKVYDAKTLRIFALGHLLGGWVVDQFDSLGILLAREAAFRDPGRDVAGHADAIIRGALDEHVGVEVKTSNSSSMRYIADEGPKPEHRMQVGCYMTMADVALMHPLSANNWLPDVWLLMYVGKDYAGVLTYEADESWKQEAVDQLDLLNRSWASGVLPVCTCTKQYGGTGPFYCGYLDRDEDIKLVAAVGAGTSKSKKDLAPKVKCCARSEEGLAVAMELRRSWDLGGR